MNRLQWQAMRRHAGDDYPAECCGILLGKMEGNCKRLMEAIPVANLRREPARARASFPSDDLGQGSERNRYLLDPVEQLRIEKGARERGLDVLGYYHSHPDHPAQPSKYDREHAWPCYSYVIISVEQGVPEDMTGWVLAADESTFGTEALIVRDSEVQESRSSQQGD